MLGKIAQEALRYCRSDYVRSRQSYPTNKEIIFTV